MYIYTCSPFLHVALLDRLTFFHITEIHTYHFTVPKANEVLYSWNSLMNDCEASSSDVIKPERAMKKKVWAKTSKNFLTAKQFQAVDILAATRNFSKECFIGEGFTGQVYRGDFPGGQVSYC